MTKTTDNHDNSLKATHRDDNLSVLYNAIEKVQPPSFLDKSILAAAQKESQARPHKNTSPFGNQWRVPLSMAAVVVLSVSLVTLMQREEPYEFDLERAVPMARDVPHKTVVPSESISTQSRERSVIVEKEEKSTNLIAEPLLLKEKRKLARDDEMNEEIDVERMELDAEHPIMSEEEMPLAPKPQKRKAEKTNAEQGQFSLDEAKAARVTSGAAKGSDSSNKIAPVSKSRAKADAVSAPTTPEDWLSLILQLYKQGQQQEAERQLSTFIKKYPHYSLDEFKQQLGQLKQ